MYKQYFCISEEEFGSLSEKEQQRCVEIHKKSFIGQMGEVGEAFSELGKTMRKEIPIIDKFFKLIERVGD